MRKNAADGRWLLLSKFHPACINADIMIRMIASRDILIFNNFNKKIVACTMQETIPERFIACNLVLSVPMIKKDGLVNQHSDADGQARRPVLL